MRHVMRRRGGALAACVVAICVGVGAAARAQALEEVSLRWHASPSCPASDQVLERTRRLLQPELRKARRLAVDISVTERTTGGYLLRVEARDSRDRSRELVMGSCDEVRDAAALLIALLIDPDLQLERDASRTEPAAPSAPARLSMRIGLPVVGFDSGLLPDPTVVLGARVGLLFGRLQAELGGLYLWPRSADAPRATAVPIDVLAGHARACALVWSTPRLEVGPCAGLWVGRIAGRPARRGAASGSALLLAPELGASLHVVISRQWGVQLDAGALLPLRRARFDVRESEELERVHTVPAISLQVRTALTFLL